MQSVDNARNALLAALTPMPSEEIDLEMAVGRILARPIVAAFDLPSFSNSSMDGFALRAADIQDATVNAPSQLRVVADIPAGSSEVHEIGPGEAARIMTGAPLPPGADSVVPVERSDFTDRSAGSPPPESVAIFSSVDRGAYVRNRGEDVSKGSLLLDIGVRLRPQDIGMAAMTGTGTIGVTRRPKIAILSTGDELLLPGAPPQQGKIFESNSLTISALAEQMGAEVVRLGIARDNEEDVQRRLDEAVASGADLILSSAGVSVGAYDYVKSVVEAYGRLDFWRVNMRPGKPVAFGVYRDIPFVGLPGNPVSAFVSFEVFLRPALAKLSGWTGWEREVFHGHLETAIESDGRESYLRARVSKSGTRWDISLTGHQGSGNQHSLVLANALVIVPADVRFLDSGSEATFWKLN